MIWLTGLSGAGKTTIALKLCERMRQRGLDVEHLDGDDIRALFPKTGFTRADRDHHVRRVGHVAAMLEKHGVTVVASLVSPYRDSRLFIRGISQNFVEVHVATSLEECERRDPKGLYKKARSGELKEFTGVSDAYEQPMNPEIEIDTVKVSLDEAVSKIMKAVDGPS